MSTAWYFDTCISSNHVCQKGKYNKFQNLPTYLYIFTYPTLNFKVVLGKQRHLTDGLTRCLYLEGTCLWIPQGEIWEPWPGVSRILDQSLQHQGQPSPTNTRHQALKYHHCTSHNKTSVHCSDLYHAKLHNRIPYYSYQIHKSQAYKCLFEFSAFKI